eukprot:scaffold294362_cov17-Tisochrysis_lutea.AAC.1
MVAKGRFSNSFKLGPANKTYFSINSRDQVFGACTEAFSVRYTGYSFWQHDDDIMSQSLHQAVHSSIQMDSPFATLILLPHWRSFINKTYMNWLNNFPGYVKMEGKFSIPPTLGPQECSHRNTQEEASLQLTHKRIGETSPT